jgi:hypothetical protein
MPQQSLEGTPVTAAYVMHCSCVGRMKEIVS